MSEPFSLTEIDYLMCAVITQQTNLTNRSMMMKRFATADHLAQHEARIALGEILLQKLTELERQ